MAQTKAQRSAAAKKAAATRKRKAAKKSAQDVKLGPQHRQGRDRPGQGRRQHRTERGEVGCEGSGCGSETVGLSARDEEDPAIFSKVEPSHPRRTVGARSSRGHRSTHRDFG